MIQGIDGYSYVVDEGKLVKIMKVEYSEKYLIDTSGYALYYTENGKVLMGR